MTELRKVWIQASDGSAIDVQHPLPTDGDSVYEKDIWVDESDATGWVDPDASGEDLVLIPFTNLHTYITYSGATNPKTLFIHFNRTVSASQVSLGAVTGNFSNVKLELYGSGGTVRDTIDLSGDSTDLTSLRIPFEPQLMNAIKLSFYTTDTVSLSNITIQKTTVVAAQIQGIKPDDTLTTIQATAGGNLKISLEEIENTISEDTNTSLRVAPILEDENGETARLHGDTLFQGVPVVIDVEHHEIHCGDSYVSSHSVDVAGTTAQDYLIIVPNEVGTPQKRYHCVFDITTEAETDMILYEGATVSANGTSIACVNRDRDSILTSSLAVYYTPTVITTGTAIFTRHWGSGRGVGGASGRANEIILANNTIYLLRLTNAVATPNYMSFELDHYIHPGI